VNRLFAFLILSCASSRGRRAPPGNTPPFPQSRPTAARHWVGVSPAGADELGGNNLGRAGEEGLGEMLGGLGGYGSGLGGVGGGYWHI